MKIILLTLALGVVDNLVRTEESSGPQAADTPEEPVRRWKCTLKCKQLWAVSLELLEVSPQMPHH